MELFDTHCHLYDAEVYPDPAAEIARAVAAGVTRLAVVGIDPESTRHALGLADAHESVWVVAGRHPNYASDFHTDEIAALEVMARHPRCVAIGEIGFDFHWKFGTLEQQTRCFEAQYALAVEMEKPLVYHCREAYPHLLETLEAREPHPALWHCFAGDEEQARRVEALGGWFGVGGTITYPKNEALRAIVGTLPRDRVVIETDAPFLAPQGHRGKTNRPELVAVVAQTLGAIWGVSQEEAARVTTDNARRFYRI